MLRLGDFVTRRGDPLQLEALTGELGLDRQIAEAEVASPGLALAGYTGRFAANRLHVLGETEITYLNSLAPEQRQQSLTGPPPAPVAALCWVASRSVRAVPAVARGLAAGNARFRTADL